MPISFTDEEKATISRRQVNIASENEAYQSQIATIDDITAKLLKVDEANDKFYSYYNNQVSRYEQEARLMDGKISDVYSNQDVIDAGISPTQAPFYPISGVTGYTKLIPLISDGIYTNNKVKGRFHHTGVDPQYEQSILSSPSNYSGIVELENFLSNGISGAIAASTTTTAGSPAIPAGSITGFVINVSSSTNFTINDLVYINKGSASGIYIVTSKASGQLTISSILPSLIGISAGTGTTVDNTVSGFSSGERQSLTHGTYQEILTNLTTNGIGILVAAWETNLDNQVIELNANDDERQTQKTQISAAIADINNSKNVIDLWQLLSDTGANGKYTSGELAYIMTELTSRTSYISTRIVEIESALGVDTNQSLIQSSEDYTATDTTNRYYQRYKWLNARINKGTGSLRRYYSLLQSKENVNKFIDSNNSILADYNQYFTTKQIVFLADEDPIIQVKDISGISVGDQVHVITDTQPAVRRVVMEIMGTNQIRLDSSVPNTYQVVDLARLYKEL